MSFNWATQSFNLKPQRTALYTSSAIPLQRFTLSESLVSLYSQKHITVDREDGTVSVCIQKFEQIGREKERRTYNNHQQFLLYRLHNCGFCSPMSQKNRK